MSRIAAFGGVCVLLMTSLTSCGQSAERAQAPVDSSTPFSAPSPSVPSPSVPAQPADPGPTPTPSPTPSTFPEALRVVARAVAKVTISTWSELPGSPGSGGCGVGVGTAFAVRPDLLVTSAHVVEGRDRTRVTFPGATVPGTVVGYDREKDVALIQIERDMPGTLEFRDEPVAVGEAVGTLGFATGQSSAFFHGDVNRINQRADVDGHFLTGLFEMDLNAQPGNSGGPVFDTSGRVLGIVAARNEEGSRWAVSAERVRPLVEQWADNPSESTQERTECLTLVGDSLDPADGPAPSISGRVHSAALTLGTYHQAITEGDYVSAHAQLADGGDLEAFTREIETSRIEGLTYLGITDDSRRPSFDVEFVSRQEAGYGPRERPDETCTQWRLRYTFAAEGGLWLIHRTTAIPGHDGTSEPCPDPSVTETDSSPAAEDGE